MRYRKKEIGCEVKYSELDIRALEYIEEFEKKYSEKMRDDCSDLKDEQDYLLTKQGKRYIIKV